MPTHSNTSLLAMPPSRAMNRQVMRVNDPAVFGGSLLVALDGLPLPKGSRVLQSPESPPMTVAEFQKLTGDQQFVALGRCCPG